VECYSKTFQASIAMRIVPPKQRLFASAIGVLAAFILENWVALAMAWGAVLLLLCIAGLLGRYLRFAVAVLVPLAVMLALTWGLVTQAPPGAPLGSDREGGIVFAAVVVLRVAVAAGILQLCLLSLPSRLLPGMLRGWGLRGEYFVAALGAYAVVPEIALRMDQVVTAYRARGLLPSGRWAAICRLPRLLRPLFVWSIRAAVQRADLWQQRALLLRAERLAAGTSEWSTARGILAISAALLFLVSAIAVRCKVFTW